MSGMGAIRMKSAGEKVKIGKSVQYGPIAIEVREAEKRPEFNSAKSPQGSLFLVVSVKVENTKSASTAFIVPDEEIWLNFGADELAKPENYKFETALEPRKSSEGFAWYVVPAEAKKFSLLFGKKKMPKTPVDFSL